MIVFPTFSAAVLLFNLRQDDRTEQIEAYLRKNGIAVRRVEPSEFNRPIGALLGLAETHQSAGTADIPFSEEMLLMSGFDQRMLQEFLSFFRQEGLRRIELKAMLTPTNAAWSACELYRHLNAERAQFTALSAQ